MEISKRTTEQVVTAHLIALVSRNLDSIMDDYHDDAVLITPTDVLVGHEALRAFFGWVLENLFTADLKIDLKKQVSEGDLGYILWEAHSEKLNIPTATDTFVILNGKISRQTALLVMNP
jgi:ketosteroid isomerase-like protein